MSDRQDALVQHYQHCLDALHAAVRGGAGSDLLSGPHLVDLDAHGYWNCARRVLIVGQETRGWLERENAAAFWQSPKPNVNLLLEQYRQFHCGKDYFRSPFWAAAASIHNAANVSGPSWAFAWSNLFKMDENLGRPTEAVQQLLREHFNVLPKEVEIAEPAAVVFFTGAPLDDALRRAFGSELAFEPVDSNVRLLARVVHPKLPRATFRTYHPNYLRQKRLWAVVEWLAAEVAA